MSRLSKRERDEIVQAYRSGEGSTAIGRRYGTTAQHVAMIVKRASVPSRDKRRVKPEPKRIRIALPPPEPIRFKRPVFVSPKQVGSGRQSAAGYLKLM